MTNEQLRMQMLAGIITESEYKAKLNEEFQKPEEDSNIEALKKRYWSETPEDLETIASKQDFKVWILGSPEFDSNAIQLGDYIKFPTDNKPTLVFKADEKSVNADYDSAEYSKFNRSLLAKMNREQSQNNTLNEWGGGIEDPRDAERYAKEREWDNRQKLSAASRGQLVAGDVVEYDGKKWMIMFIYPDGDLDLKMTQPFRDEMGITKIGDPRAYAEKVSRSEIK